MTATVRSFWFGEALSPIEHLCLKSFLAHGHRVDLYTYEKVDNVPRGCNILDAATVVDRDELFVYQDATHSGSPAGFSNIFRYTLLDRDGGWWVDTDTLCLRSELPESEYVFARQGNDRFNTAILRAPAASPLIREALDRARRIVADHDGDIKFGAIGPHLLTEVIRDLDLGGKATDRRALYPLPYWEALATCDPRRRAEVEFLVADSTFLHLWTEMFRHWRVPKSARPPAGSYLAEMYDRYRIPFPAAGEFDWRSALEPKRDAAITPQPVTRDYTPLPPANRESARPAAP
jgi:hypothetical protein